MNIETDPFKATLAAYSMLGNLRGIESLRVKESLRHLYAIAGKEESDFQSMMTLGLMAAMGEDVRDIRTMWGSMQGRLKALVRPNP